MKLAICANGPHVESKVASKFEESHCFIIIDLAHPADFEILENDSIKSLDDSGILTAHMLINTGVSAVLTGYCKPNAIRVLEMAKIKVYDNVKGKVIDCIKDNLTEIDRSIDAIPIRIEKITLKPNKGDMRKME
jgi:predicted Fe-Mo cluster-binding NifX family protein